MKTPLKTLSLFIHITLISLLTAACGSGTETIEIRNYKMAVLDDDPEVKWEFEQLITDFNAFAGLEVLEYVDHANQANSVVFLSKGLKDNSPKKNKIGYGQWLAEIREDQWFAKPGQQRQRVVTYAMRIELDEDYIRKRMLEETQTATKEKQVLFFHEVGHGLEMDHHGDYNDIMYKDVAANRDFEPFFDRVRAYMSN